MDEILQIPNSTTNPLSQRDYSPDKFSIMNESRNGNYKQTIQKQTSKKYSIDTSIKATNKFIKKGSLKMPPLCNNSSSINMGSLSNHQNPIFLPNLQSCINNNLIFTVANNNNLNPNSTLSANTNNSAANVNIPATGNLSNTNCNFGSTNGVNLGASMHSQIELSPQAYSNNKYQEQIIRKIANSSSFMGNQYTSSPTSRIHKESSKQSLGTIYSSGTGVQNHYQQQQSTRQSQFRSSRLYKKFYNPNGINSNPPTHHLINHDLQQSLGTLNGGNSNHSLDKMPYQRQHPQAYQAVENITSGQTSVSKQRNTTHNTLQHNLQPTSIFNSQQQQSSNIAAVNQARKGMSMYQKRKMKINQVSLGNISITDERSTDIHEESSFNNQSLTNNLHQHTNGGGVGITPYKTVNNFNNLKSVTKSTSSKQSSQLRHQQNSSTHHTNINILESQHHSLNDQLRSYQRKSKFTNHKDGSQSQNTNELLSDRDYANPPSISLINDPNNVNAQTLLLKIEEENSDFKSKSKNGQSQQFLKQHGQQQEETNINKVSSKTELPELRQSKFQVQQSNMNLLPSTYNRLQNNQSINLNRLSQQQRQQQAFLSSETSSRAQLTQLGSSHHHHDTMSFMDKLQLSGKKKTSKVSHLRVNQDMLINNTNNQSNINNLTEIETSVSPRYLIDNGSKQGNKMLPSQKKQSSQSLSLKTQTYFNQSANKIRIEINKEESVLQFLTKDHKQGQSLLYYDFNGANQRINQKQQRGVVQHHNLADLIIPEETEELPMINITNKDQILSRSDSAQILARIAKNSIAASNAYSNQNTLPSQQSITQQSVSPRQEVEIVNQKIDKARKKISRYFAQNQSLSNLSMNTNPNPNQSTMNRDQHSLKNLSVDMVRMGSPFFGTHIQSHLQSNSPKFINGKQSSSSMKFSPKKQQSQQNATHQHQQTFQEKGKSQFFNIEHKAANNKKDSQQLYVNTNTQNDDQTNNSKLGDITKDRADSRDYDDHYVNDEEYPNDFSFNHDDVASSRQHDQIHHAQIQIDNEDRDDKDLLSVKNLEEVNVKVVSTRQSIITKQPQSQSNNHLKIKDDSYSQDSFIDEGGRGHNSMSLVAAQHNQSLYNSSHQMISQSSKQSKQQTFPEINNNNMKKQIKNVELHHFDRSRLKQVKRTSTVDYVKEDENIWS